MYKRQVIKKSEDGEELTGAAFVSFILDATDHTKGPVAILTVDGKDREAVCNVIDLSRESLGLSLMDDVYPNDEEYSATVHEQFQHYATYLATRGLCLGYLDPGWDDPCAIVVSAGRKADFETFVGESLPDLQVTFL